MSKTPILVVGDPHGNWGPLYDALADRPEPGDIILLGDLELRAPLHEELADVFAADWRVHFIVGKHDRASCQAYRWLVDDHPEGDLSTRVADVGGVRVAGLSGLFKSRIWLPPSEPIYGGRRDWLVRNAPLRWGDGVPLHLRDTVWPEDVEALARLRADVLVTHEGPSSVWRGMGHEEIDRLAAEMGVRLVIHGHHHHSGLAVLPGGIAVRSMGKAEVWELEMPR